MKIITSVHVTEHIDIPVSVKYIQIDIHEVEVMNVSKMDKQVCYYGGKDLAVVYERHYIQISLKSIERV